MKSHKSIQMFVSNSNSVECPAKAYLERPPEGLTVNGYRNWVAGYMTQVDTHWDRCRQKFISVLGKHDGKLAANALGHLVRNLGHCATCPLKCYAPGSDHLNADECMLLGLIASIQHGDDEAMEASVNALSCRAKCSQVIAPAGEYAMILKSVGSLLLPVPAQVLAEIHANHQFINNKSNQTIH